MAYAGSATESMAGYPYGEFISRHGGWRQGLMSASVQDRGEPGRHVRVEGNGLDQLVPWRSEVTRQKRIEPRDAQPCGRLRRRAGLLGQETQDRHFPEDGVGKGRAPALYPKLPYATKDLTPMISLAQFPNVLVAPTRLRANTLAELVAQQRSGPQPLSIASSGNGTSTHLTAELLKSVTHLPLTHVPFKGSGAAISDTAGGQVDLLFTGYATVSQLIKAGRLKPWLLGPGSAAPPYRASSAAS